MPFNNRHRLMAAIQGQAKHNPGGEEQARLAAVRPLVPLLGVAMVSHPCGEGGERGRREEDERRGAGPQGHVPLVEEIGADLVGFVHEALRCVPRPGRPERRGAVVPAEVLDGVDGLIDAVQETLDVRPVVLVGRLDDPVPQRFAVVRPVRLEGSRRPG